MVAVPRALARHPTATGAIHSPTCSYPAKCPNKILNSEGNYVGCKSMCGCQNAAKMEHRDVHPACPSMTSVSSIMNMPSSPGGYCGCPQSYCVDWLRNLFNHDGAGQRYCNAITEMTRGSQGTRAVYCQAYDDNAGTRSYGNGVIKATFCDKGFEWAASKAKLLSNASFVIMYM